MPQKQQRLAQELAYNLPSREHVDYLHKKAVDAGFYSPFFVDPGKSVQRLHVPGTEMEGHFHNPLRYWHELADYEKDHGYAPYGSVCSNFGRFFCAIPALIQKTCREGKNLVRSNTARTLFTEDEVQMKNRTSPFLPRNKDPRVPFGRETAWIPRIDMPKPHPYNQWVYPQNMQAQWSQPAPPGPASAQHSGTLPPPVPPRSQQQQPMSQQFEHWSAASWPNR